ncbi:6-phosphogluconate dehydrogenase [Nematocida sp. LUAm3]|nr:6-phosphogluconate dehydrogenase [Nematocida sp. LUAm3]KAI5173978.1 6-phosphogluconate dehydrogenase [Nematocida sp. LUAm2]KAI5177277.1 6-phosphogluconate dehydrogenase [Nematocida sp. LUAm1]
MDIGVVGLGVMGENLILNAEEKGYSVAVYNRTSSKTEQFISTHSKSSLKGYKDKNQFIMSLKRPRKILLMIKAGDAVDTFLKEVEEFLEQDDVVIDGGNSNYKDTLRRSKSTEGKFLFLGCGISGGEEGARKGPSLMPGGTKKGWETVSEFLQRIAAISPSGSPCCQWIGPQGSGHLVKTVHNGIEYAEMQIIADIYQILRQTTPPHEIADLLSSWKDKTSGFLLEITEKVLRKEDSSGKIIDRIVDLAEQKGTGIWTAQEALEVSVSSSIITEAVNSRIISSKKEERVKLSKILPNGSLKDLPLPSSEEIRRLFLLCRALAYIQGFLLIRRVSENNQWNICLKTLCLVWSNGCIIRSEFLERLALICEDTPMESSQEFISIAEEGIEPLRRFVSYAVAKGISIPCISSSLSYYDGIRTEKGSGNLIQALRDFFGAHTLLLEDAPEHVHITW